MSGDVPMSSERRPRSVYSVGSEPDPRFSLANERTALAWMRTGMSVIAAGVALAVYAHAANAPLWIRISSVLACVAGAGIGLWSLVHWRHVEVALRSDRPIPAPSLLLALPVALIPIAAIVSAIALGVLGG